MTILNPDKRFSLSVGGMVLFGSYPTPRVDIEIDVAVAQTLKGLRQEHVPDETYLYALICVTLNRVIERWPKELEQYAGHIEDCFDTELVDEIYSAYRKSFQEFRASLKKNGDPASALQRGSDPGSLSDAGVQNTPERTDAPRSVAGTETLFADGESGPRRSEPDLSEGSSPHTPGGRRLRRAHRPHA